MKPIITLYTYYTEVKKPPDRSNSYTHVITNTNPLLIKAALINDQSVSNKVEAIIDLADDNYLVILYITVVHQTHQ